MGNEKQEQEINSEVMLNKRLNTTLNVYKVFHVPLFASSCVKRRQNGHKVTFIAFLMSYFRP